MTTTFLKAALAVAVALGLMATSAMAQDSIQLPAPAKTGGKPLFDAMSARKSDRNFKPDELTPAQLSGILWSAFGITRDDGKRTIPTARGRNELQVYAVLKTGVYLYDAESNTLKLALAGDFTQEYAKSPLTLLYAAPNEVLGGLHAGSAYQSVGLYCASEGLANVVKVTGADELKGKLKLPSGYEVLVVQSIGLPG
ncbi:MAG: nitroreductase family protein [Deltaproteobacteria bacterium]|jgi:hypothetical protein|nr:nitroreductase family protein [Deltaproteobacteria bacterium]